MAFCIDLGSFMKFAQVVLNPSEMTDNTKASIGSGSGSDPASPLNSLYSVEAVMTGTDSHQTLYASSIDIQAQKYNLVHDIPLWQTLEGGASQCSDCASVGIDRLPYGTQRISVNTTFPAGTTGGTLYLTSFLTQTILL